MPIDVNGTQHLTAANPRRRQMGMWVAALAVLVVLILMVRHLSLEDATLRLAANLRGRGWSGVVAFVLLYAAAEVFMMPGALLTMAAGYVYGVWWGVAVAAAAGLLAATASFLLARTAFRDRIRAWLGPSPHFEAIRSAIAENSIVVVLLLRLSPLVPFNVANYAFGLSDVPLSRYVVASLLGMLPGAWLYASIGSIAPSLLSSGPSVPAGTRLALLLAGLSASAAAVYVVGMASRRRLAQLQTAPAAER